MSERRIIITGAASGIAAATMAELKQSFDGAPPPVSEFAGRLSRRWGRHMDLSARIRML